MGIQDALDGLKDKAQDVLDKTDIDDKIVDGAKKAKEKLKDAKLPDAVMSQMPKLARNVKTPLVKVKIGSQIMTMFCDEKIFDLVPVKKEVKAEISGMYLMSVKGIHGTQIQKETKKKSKFKQLIEKAQEKAGAKPIK